MAFDYAGATGFLSGGVWEPMTGFFLVLGGLGLAYVVIGAIKDYAATKAK